MLERADAHMHLFAHGYQGESFVHRPGVKVDEPACYASLANDHGVRAALVVGYEGQDWTAGNNAFIATMARQHDWVRPAAFVDPLDPPGIDQLEAWRSQGFVGLSMYIFEQAQREALLALDERFWSWLVDRHWLISVNSQGENWRVWLPILERHGGLRVVASHLGLPPRVAAAPGAAEAKHAIAEVAALSRFPGPRVKISGFYAMTEPGHDYPHTPAWPYVEAIRTAFGAERLLWGSDYFPASEWLSFPQTYDLFSKMPFLTEAERNRIEGANLLTLFKEALA